MSGTILPEGLTRVGFYSPDQFTELGELLRESAPQTERIGLHVSTHIDQVNVFFEPKGLEEQARRLIAPLLAGSNTLSYSLDLRGRQYYQQLLHKTRRSIWHTEGRSRATSNIASLTTDILVDHKPVDDTNTPLRALTCLALRETYDLSIFDIVGMSDDDLVTLGIEIYNPQPGDVYDYSDIIHRAPDFSSNPQTGNRIFARTTLH